MPEPPSRQREYEQVAWLSAPAMRYPSMYCWLVLLSSMDIMLTWVILERGGTEVNPVARLVIDSWSLPGAILFKFSLTLFVIIVCEIAGRDRDRVGRGLALVAIAVSAIPVVYSMGLLLAHSSYF